MQTNRLVQDPTDFILGLNTTSKTLEDLSNQQERLNMLVELFDSLQSLTTCGIGGMIRSFTVAISAVSVTAPGEVQFVAEQFEPLQAVFAKVIANRDLVNDIFAELADAECEVEKAIAKMAKGGAA